MSKTRSWTEWQITQEILVLGIYCPSLFSCITNVVASSNVDIDSSCLGLIVFTQGKVLLITIGLFNLSIGLYATVCKLSRFRKVTDHYGVVAELNSRDQEIHANHKWD